MRRRSRRPWSGAPARLPRPSASSARSYAARKPAILCGRGARKRRCSATLAGGSSESLGGLPRHEPLAPRMRRWRIRRRADPIRERSAGKVGRPAVRLRPAKDARVAVLRRRRSASREQTVATEAPASGAPRRLRRGRRVARRRRAARVRSFSTQSVPRARGGRAARPSREEVRGCATRGRPRSLSVADRFVPPVKRRVCGSCTSSEERHDGPADARHPERARARGETRRPSERPGRAPVRRTPPVVASVTRARRMKTQAEYFAYAFVSLPGSARVVVEHEEARRRTECALRQLPPAYVFYGEKPGGDTRERPRAPRSNPWSVVPASASRSSSSAF